jgi:multiple sugar transport system permease protein/raffinose/stachyose/melibiose transport system permease protein
MPRALPRLLLLGGLLLYTAFVLGPLVWLAIMSLRTTPEINLAPYALPGVYHWDKYVTAWTRSNYGAYFWNSTLVALGAVSIVTVIGAMAAYCLGRRQFPGNRAMLYLIVSTIILPPQITIIALFQVLVGYRLYNTLGGLILAYVGTQLPLTVYILESFFARLPQDLFDAARMDGYAELEIFWRIAVPVGMPAVVTTVILNLILLWNEFLFAVVLIADDAKRTLPLGLQKFMGDQFVDVGMIATGVMISVIPVIAVYAFFSERIIQGMTAGAVR